MMIDLEQSLWNRTGRRNDKSARGHETAQGLTRKFIDSVDTFLLGFIISKKRERLSTELLVRI